MTLALDLALVQRTHLHGEAVMGLLVFKNLGDRPVSLAGASGVHPVFVARGPASAHIEIVPESDTRRDIAPGTAAGGFHDVNAGGALAGDGTYELVAALAVGDETVQSNAVEVVIDAPSLSEPRVTIHPRVELSTGSLVALHRGARFNAVVAFPIATDPRSAHGLVLRPPRTLAEIHTSARSPLAPRRGAFTPGDKPTWAAVWLEDGALGAATHAHMAPPTRLPLDTAPLTLLGGHILADESLVMLLLDVVADELGEAPRLVPVQPLEGA